MTLIVALSAEDGVIFASDTQVTAGAIRYKKTKIERLGTKCLWAASGQLAIIQRLGDAMQPLADLPSTLRSVRDLVSQAVTSSMSEMLRNDFRTQFFASDPEALLRLHEIDILCAGRDNGRNEILHVARDGTSEWIYEPWYAASGSGSIFANALLHKYADYIPRMDLAKAALLAYKIIEETADVGSYGVSLPADIWQVTDSGVKRLGQDELAALGDSAQMLRDEEVRLLLGRSAEPEEEVAASAP